MKVFKKNKGFTLVELIVVIAIIGILAAVLIPSITGFIDKGRISNDTVDAKNMNTLLSTYLLENNVDGTELDAEDVKYIIQTQDSQYNFIPKYKNGVFFYNQNESKIEYSSSGIDGIQLYAAEGDDYTSVEDIYGIGKLYLNSNGPVADFLKNLRNIDNLGMYTSLGSNIPDGLSDVYSAFNPATTLFIGSSNVFSSADPNTKITKIVFANNLKAIINPNIYDKYSIDPTVIINVPLSVSFISNYAFDYLVGNVTINIKSTSTKVIENSFGPNVTTNAKTVLASSLYNALEENNSLVVIQNKQSEKIDGVKSTDNSGALVIDITGITGVTYEDIELNISALQTANPSLKSLQADVDHAGSTVRIITFMAFDDSGIIAYVKIKVSSPQVEN